MNPIPGGTYRVNERMLEDLEHAVHGEHPSNLGAALARSIGDQIGVPSFVVDPVSVDELMPKARISGISDLERPSWFHALNHKAVARWQRSVSERSMRRAADHSPSGFRKLRGGPQKRPDDRWKRRQDQRSLFSGAERRTSYLPPGGAVLFRKIHP